MRYDIAISAPWRPLFSLFGFKARDSYVEIDDDALTFSFGTAHERVPLSRVSGARTRHWPLYYGLGAKLGPDRGVAYVGSTKGVLKIEFKQPVPMNVWGFFRASKAECAIVSLEDPEGFTRALEAKLATDRAA